MYLPSTDDDGSAVTSSRHRQPAVHRHTLARDGVGRLRREEDARLREVFDGRRLAEGRRSGDVSEDFVRTASALSLLL